MTKFIYLIGYPLKHSISPEFQQAALDYYGLDVRYQLREVEEGLLASVVEDLRMPQSLGANVTVPYKERVLSLLDRTDDLARVVGAVNTIVNDGGSLVGYNTDVVGFVTALKDADFEPRDRRAVILGAGGAARAVGFALVREKVAWLAVVNRTKARADRLVSDLANYARAKGLATQVLALAWAESELRVAVKSCELIVNCTTLGMRHTAQEGESPLTEDMLGEGVLVYDLVYNPRETALLKVAKRAGAKTLSGLPMLVHQGAAAFKLWTQKEPPLSVMFRAAENALTKMGG